MLGEEEDEEMATVETKTATAWQFPVDVLEFAHRKGLE